MSLVRNLFIGSIVSICIFVITGIFLGSLDVPIERSQAPLMMIAIPIVLLCGLLVTCSLSIVDAIKQTSNREENENQIN